MTERTLTASLPLPPTVNASYAAGQTRGGRSVFYKTEAARKWMDLAVALLRLQWNASPTADLSPDTVSSASIRWVLYCGRTSDLDGPAKALIDAVFTALDLNDKIVNELHASKVVTPQRAERHVDVEITLQCISAS